MVERFNLFKGDFVERDSLGVGLIRVGFFVIVAPKPLFIPIPIESIMTTAAVPITTPKTVRALRAFLLRKFERAKPIMSKNFIANTHSSGGVLFFIVLR